MSRNYCTHEHQYEQVWKDRLQRLSCQHRSYAREEVVLWQKERDHLQLNGHDLWREKHVAKQVCGNCDERRYWVALLCENQDSRAYQVVRLYGF
jgi:hypothetical protein